MGLRQSTVTRLSTVPQLRFRRVRTTATLLIEAAVEVPMRYQKSPLLPRQGHAAVVLLVQLSRRRSRTQPGSGERAVPRYLGEWEVATGLTMLAKTAVGLMRVTTHAQLLLDLALVAKCGVLAWIPMGIVMLAIIRAVKECPRARGENPFPMETRVVLAAVRTAGGGVTMDVAKESGGVRGQDLLTVDTRAVAAAVVMSGLISRCSGLSDMPSDMHVGQEQHSMVEVVTVP